MNWEIKNLMCDLKILKEKFEDLKDNHGSHFEDLYLHEPNHTLNKDDAIKEGFSYHERRIHNDQMFDALEKRHLSPTKAKITHKKIKIYKIIPLIF